MGDTITELKTKKECRKATISLLEPEDFHTMGIIPKKIAFRDFLAASLFYVPVQSPTNGVSP